jgi:hypothetical protein
VSRIAALTESSGQIGMAFSTYNGSTAERMRIDANGNVGIGTDDPATYLHLSATNSDPGDTEGDLVGTHNLTEYLRFTSKGDSGDVNSVSVGFKWVLMITVIVIQTVALIFVQMMDLLWVILRYYTR